jgi:hypothetical protein
VTAEPSAVLATSGGTVASGFEAVLGGTAPHDAALARSRPIRTRRSRRGARFTVRCLPSSSPNGTARPGVRGRLMPLRTLGRGRIVRLLTSVREEVRDA